MTERDEASTPTRVGLSEGLGGVVPERADVDALLADPTYYEPRTAKTPLPRGCHECAWGKVLGCWRCGGR